MPRRGLAVLLGAVLLLLAAAPGFSVYPAQGAPLAGKACTAATKHHKRACAARPKPTATPTPLPPSVSVAPRACTSATSGDGCADEGFSISYSNGVLTASNAVYGHEADFSQFAVARQRDGHFEILMFLKLSKKASPSDGDNPTWTASGNDFQLTAATGQHYAFMSSCRSPELQSTEMENGESGQGWICSDAIDAAHIDGTFTLSWDDFGKDGMQSVPLLDLTVS